ncbi:MAG: DUF1810 domain-containing protein [Vulcanimicrobiaceae bacterium]
MNDPFDLRRFEAAQAPVYQGVLEELRRGRKREHWMWFVFPQIAGLGRSPTAQAFAIRSLDEAKAYLAHPVLGARLRECTRLVLALDGANAQDIFGSVDSLKFRSSMTLFAQASESEPTFADALAKYFEGKTDTSTLEILRGTVEAPATRNDR